MLGASRSITAPYIVTELDPVTGAIFAYNALDIDFGQRIAFVDLAGLQTAWTCNRTEFIGRNGNMEAPIAFSQPKPLKSLVGAGFDPCAVLATQVELAIEQSIEIILLLGQSSDREHANELIQRYRSADLQKTFTNVKQSWDKTLRKVQVETPDRALNLMLNGWLLYQTISCRKWARAAFYQAGGAFGYRDQLQDSMALVVSAPGLPAPIYFVLRLINLSRVMYSIGGTHHLIAECALIFQMILSGYLMQFLTILR